MWLGLKGYNIFNVTLKWVNENNTSMHVCIFINIHTETFTHKVNNKAFGTKG